MIFMCGQEEALLLVVQSTGLRVRKTRISNSRLLPNHSKAQSFNL